MILKLLSSHLRKRDFITTTSFTEQFNVTYILNGNKISSQNFRNDAMMQLTGIGQREQI